MNTGGGTVLPVANTGFANASTNFNTTSTPSANVDTVMIAANTEKGGMRGFGLLAMVIAELALKVKAINLAEDYYKTNKKDFDFFTGNHEGPMRDTAIEAFGPLNPYYNYDLYASVPAGIAKAGIIDRQWFEARRRIPKYNTGQNARLDYDMSIARVAAVVAGWNLAVRYEYNWADEHNNRAMDRKVAVANMGIGIGNIVQQGLSTAVSNLSTAYDKIGDTVSSIGNGYSSMRGYDAGRKDAKARFNEMTASARGPQ